MTDYSRSIIFADKDALLTSDPNKVTRGVEIDVELDAAQSAINSKLDLTDMADNAQALTQTDLTHVMAPQRTWEVVASWASTTYDVHVANVSIHAPLTGALAQVVLTQAEYNALAPADPDTLYFIEP